MSSSQSETLFHASSSYRPSTFSHFNFQPENHWSIESILHQTPEWWSATQALLLPHSWTASSHHLDPFLGRTRVTSVRFWSPALPWWRSVCSQVESCLTVKRDVTKKKKRPEITMFSEPERSLNPQQSWRTTVKKKKGGKVFGRRAATSGWEIRKTR